MTTSPSSIHFTPRQVVMALESQSVKKEKKEKRSKKGSSEVLEGSKEMVLNGGGLSAGAKGREILLRSIAGFLESNGFKKTLAMFQSEAQIEENSWKSPAVNLDDFVAKLSELSDALAVPAIEKSKPQGIEKETQKKTKKKSANDTTGEQTVHEKTTLSKPVEEEQHLGKKEKRKKSSEESKPVEEEREVDNQEKKDKKKKKYSDPSESCNVNGEKDDTKKEKEEKMKKKKEIEEVKKPKQMKEEVNATYENEQSETSEKVAKKKHKEEKKRKKKETEVAKEVQEKEEKEKVTHEETIVENGEKTLSKKRKKGEEENVENDGKKRKLDANGSAKTSHEENVNGPESGKKEMESAEPKSANAFKRVKVEEVQFADQRLQDNSYWAKHGADSGYGAKAQEILEQVKGRDFRHEKTKKKRGTYRGGQIDLQSHSIKFNYSDDE